jgi:hypothetical protein
LEREKIKNEMLKIVNDLYWHDSDEAALLTNFIEDFFSQYQPERSKREDFFLANTYEGSLKYITLEEFENDMLGVIKRCGTLNSMET